MAVRYVGPGTSIFGFLHPAGNAAADKELVQATRVTCSWLRRCEVPKRIARALLAALEQEPRRSNYQIQRY